MIILKICYIKEMHETCDFVKRILIKIKKLFNIVEFSEDKGKTTIILPLFKSNIIKDKKIIVFDKENDEVRLGSVEDIVPYVQNPDNYSSVFLDTLWGPVIYCVVYR